MIVSFVVQMLFLVEPEALTSSLYQLCVNAEFVLL